MADVRALLKAKREEKRVSHPFAAYNQAGQLRCTACSTIVKHASAWNGHVGSKAHRTNAARVKEEERLKEEEKRQGKRKANDEDEGDGEDAAEVPLKKQKVDNGNTDQTAASANKSVSGFPTDFFSDPTRSIKVGEFDSDDEGDKDNSLPPVTAQSLQSQSELDLEWARFQETVINAPVQIDARETYDRATILAEPELVAEIPEGFPTSVVGEAEAQPEPDAVTVPKDDVEQRKRRAEEDKELIMDRLLDEERAQEEADERVNALKTRLEFIKQKRMAAKATRSTK